jgi:magnesium transporter
MRTPPGAGPSKLDEIARLLDRHRVLESFAERQQTDKRDLLAQMQRRENIVELKKHLRGTHPADLAAILSSLPNDDRLLVFGQLAPRDAGLTLVEMDEEIREAMVDSLTSAELVAAVRDLDADDLAYLSSSLPDEVVRAASGELGAAGRSWIVDSSAYPEDSVGRLMRQDVIAVRGEQTAGEILESLRGGGDLPAQTDRLFVIDARHLLRGTVPLQALIRADPRTALADVASPDVAAFTPDDPAEQAAKAFARYDLVSAPVVDGLGKLVGRVTIDAVLDFQRASLEQDALTRAGLRGAEDLFAPVSESLRNRWPWLALNLLTAFVASRVIGAFEQTISQVVALAALMPIVASIGGNTGNQTVALVVRALALDQLHDRQGRLTRKEIAVGAVNGAAWGLVVGLLALVLYRSAALAGVMSAAVFLNLVVAALAGVAVPLALRSTGRDPAHGASVVLTFVTDSMGFFLFLGLARLFLV